MIDMELSLNYILWLQDLLCAHADLEALTAEPVWGLDMYARI